MADVESLGAKAVESLGLSPKVENALKDIQVELADAYRESFLAMVEAMNRQASALGRIQTTLAIVLKHLEPKLGDKVLPVAVAAVEDGKESDLAKALIVADPIAAGYTLSQSALAQALKLPQSDVSILVRAFKLSSDGECAVTVRKGEARPMVNYHPRAMKKFLKLVAEPPSDLGQTALQALKRVRSRLVLAQIFEHSDG